MSKRILISTVTGAMLVSAAVPAFAFGFGRGSAGGADLPEEVREQMTACRDLETKEETRDCHHEIMTQYREENGIEQGEGCMGNKGFKRRPNMRRMPEEVKEDLEACREASEDREVVRDCVHNVMTTYKEDNGIEGFQTGHGQGFGRREGIGRNVPEEVRDSMKACRENNPEDRDAAHECVKEVMDEYKSA